MCLDGTLCMPPQEWLASTHFIIFITYNSHHLAEPTTWLLFVRAVASIHDVNVPIRSHFDNTTHFLEVHNITQMLGAQTESTALIPQDF